MSGDSFLSDVWLQLTYCCGVSSVDAEALLEKHVDEILRRAGENPYDVALELLDRSGDEAA